MAGFTSPGSSAVPWAMRGHEWTPVFASCWCGHRKLAKSVRKISPSLCFKGVWLILVNAVLQNMNDTFGFIGITLLTIENYSYLVILANSNKE